MIKYYPYGERRNSQGTLGTDKLFTGQRLDDTGLYYYGARYYDPTIGRFISPDTIVPQSANPQALNRYSYVLNNPLRYTDPTGYDVNWWVVGGGVTLLVAGGILCWYLAPVAFLPLLLKWLLLMRLLLLEWDLGLLCSRP
ncbi:MAG: RHS repeat-associated core domain-containing protein [Chloroflexota bacterium]